jgi:hypothetical protein
MSRRSRRVRGLLLLLLWMPAASANALLCGLCEFAGPGTAEHRHDHHAPEGRGHAHGEAAVMDQGSCPGVQLLVAPALLAPAVELPAPDAVGADVSVEVPSLAPMAAPRPELPPPRG